MVFCMINYRFLAQLGALILLDEADNIMDLKDIFVKCADRQYGCTWESFEAYRYGTFFIMRRDFIFFFCLTEISLYHLNGLFVNRLSMCIDDENKLYHFLSLVIIRSIKLIMLRCLIYLSLFNHLEQDCVKLVESCKY
jgi:hypothetical protein